MLETTTVKSMLKCLVLNGLSSHVTKYRTSILYSIQMNPVFGIQWLLCVCFIRKPCLHLFLPSKRSSIGTVTMFFISEIGFVHNWFKQKHY